MTVTARLGSDANRGLGVGVRENLHPRAATASGDLNAVARACKQIHDLDVKVGLFPGKDIMTGDGTDTQAGHVPVGVQQ